MSKSADLAAESGGLRPSLRPLLIAGAANVILAGFLLGVPYARGPERARAVGPRFARFAACFFDAAPADEPGLGLPPGDRGRYASLVVHAAPAWPGRCRDALAAVPPEETMFLFPAVKDAEARLRAATALVDAELAALQRRRDASEVTVSDRPMRAMERLRSALAELGLSASVDDLSAERVAVHFDESAADLPTPSIVPTRVSQDAPLALAVRDGTLVAGAMDDRTLAHVRVAEGGVEQRLSRRPPVVSALLGARQPPYVVWSTDPAQCAAEADGCAQRATGLAAFLEDRQTLEPAAWLRAHPAGDPRAAVLVRDRTAWVVAEGDEGLEVRRFALPEPRVRALGEEVEVPQLAPEASWPLDVLDVDVDTDADAGVELAWIDGEPPRLVFAAAGRAGTLRLEASATPSSFEAPAGTVRVATCADGWVAVGSEHGLTVHHAESGARHPLGLRLLPPAPGALRLLCTGEGADLWVRSDGALTRVRCDAGGCGEPEGIVDAEVEAFDVARIGADTLAAWTTDAADGPIRVTRVAAEGESTTAVPAACWTDPRDGLCGAPRLASDGDTAMLVARDETDLRVVQTHDGESWSALRGLGQP